MNIVDREWKDAPFRYRRLTLANLIKDFVWRRASSWSILHKNRDDIVDFCAESPSLRVAIERACRSKRPNGKHHNHQSKVKAEVLRQLEMRLIFWDRRTWNKHDTFAKLHAFVHTNAPKGIGPVTVYDVSTRIGAYLDLTPQAIYLHAGCRAGFDALMASPAIGPVRRETFAIHRAVGVVPKSAFPVCFTRLSADAIEDFLCVYRTVFASCTK